MKTEIRIDKTNDRPVYRQIIEQITRLVREGAFASGDKVPTERDLADTLGVARGTVNRAYEELTRSNVLESIPGRGSFVSPRQDVSESGRKEKAVVLIGDLVDSLRELRFSYREIRTLVELGIMERERLFDELAIAVVDCNPEALAVFRKQLNILSHMPVTLLLLDDMANSMESDKKLAPFDLILTTARHYTELLGMAPGQKEKIVQVALSPSQETIIALASVKPRSRLGVFCESRQFRDIMMNKLKDLMLDQGVGELRYAEAEAFPDFLKDKDILLVPPSWTPPAGKEAQGAILAFADRGGRFIVFDYQVERGSMMYVEERVRDLLSH
jgi:DNA-binding transcriptional regulator YhcF (GntR family)